MSVTQVWERLFVGDIYDADALVESNPLRITTVVTLCPESVPDEVCGIDHLCLPMLDNRPIPEAPGMATAHRSVSYGRAALQFASEMRRSHDEKGTSEAGTNYAQRLCVFKKGGDRAVCAR
jgi:hypothetical protein